MPLSEHERDVLRQIEQSLLEDDPRFAARMEGRHRSVMRRVVLGALCVVCGFLLVLAGAFLQLLYLGVSGFAVMVAGGYYASLGIGPSRLPFGRPSLGLPGQSQHI
jgi:sterol desaturase/sphingolipid hydroxylase (fatty acid hydroxylase superfamily)